MIVIKGSPHSRMKPSRKKLVLEMIAKQKVSNDEFFGTGRTSRIVRARIAVIRKLAEDGAYINEIARLTKLCHSTVRYHLYDHLKDKRREYHRIKWRNMKDNNTELYQSILNRRRKTNRKYTVNREYERKAA